MDAFIDVCEYVVILVLVLTIVWMLFDRRRTLAENSTLEWINQGHPSGKFGAFNPAERLKDVIGKYGPPDIIDKRKGGVAIWKKESLEKKGFCWDRVEIRDEQVPHKHPAPHVDFLYTWYKLYVPDDLICDIGKLSESVSYDPLKKMVRVRCHFDGANYSTMVLAKRIANREMTIEQAKKSYGPFIFSTIKGHDMYNPDAQNAMEQELCNFKKEQKWEI